VNTSMFTPEDVDMIARTGLSVDEVMKQIDQFNHGLQPMCLVRPCTVGDGIITIPLEQRQTFMEAHDRAASRGMMIKFVPASGAASRMFKDWFALAGTADLKDSQSAEEFAEDLPRYPFYDDLKEALRRDGHNISSLMKERRFSTILNYILMARGLNYGHLPKAVLKFHSYREHTRTALEEHLVEAARYVKDSEGICRIHLTLSPEHQSEVEHHISQVVERYERRYNVRFDIAISLQLPSTDTIAVDMANMPFRDNEGHLVFRPGGHGSLLKNLNIIDYDIIFIKNIDNVAPDRLKEDTILFKKILGGYLVLLQDRIHSYIRYLENKPVSDETVAHAGAFCRDTLCASLPENFEEFDRSRMIRFLLNKLNRPLRVCGMVKNVGEPGGGPFWVSRHGAMSIQIIEQAQVDMTADDQKGIWSSSTHFNPVDIVCAVKDYRGNKFDLEAFVDTGAYFISEKSLEGKRLKALEHPGLWNGAMAGWNTVFVEVPITTFSPVKTVHDLLRKEHLEL
jgi:hypothetical protein